MKIQSVLMVIAALYGCSAAQKLAQEPADPATVAETSSISSQPSREKARVYPRLQTTQEELDGIIDSMQAEADAFEGKDAETIELVMRMLRQGNKEELKRFLDTPDPFPFSDKRHQMYWTTAAGYAFIFLDFKDCKERYEALAYILPNIMRVRPPEEQLLHWAAGYMLLTRLKDIYECNQSGV